MARASSYWWESFTCQLQKVPSFQSERDINNTARFYHEKTLLLLLQMCRFSCGVLLFCKFKNISLYLKFFQQQPASERYNKGVKYEPKQVLWIFWGFATNNTHFGQLGNLKAGCALGWVRTQLRFEKKTSTSEVCADQKWTPNASHTKVGSSQRWPKWRRVWTTY